MKPVLCVRHSILKNFSAFSSRCLKIFKSFNELHFNSKSIATLGSVNLIDLETYWPSAERNRLEEIYEELLPGALNNNNGCNFESNSS